MDITPGTVSAATYDPISLANCHDWLGIPTGITEDDAAIEFMRDGAITWLENQLYGHLVMLRDIVDEKHHINDNMIDRIVTQYKPIVQVYALTDDATAVAAADFAIMKEAGIIVLKDDWFVSGFEKAKITYQAGYAEADVPNDIKMAMLALVKTLYDEAYAMSDQYGEKMAGYSYVRKNATSTLNKKLFEEQLPMPVINVINYYRARGI